jgi:hypothetical protein
MSSQPQSVRSDVHRKSGQNISDSNTLSLRRLSNLRIGCGSAIPQWATVHFHTFPCLCETASLKQLGKDDEARTKLIAVRDFIEQGKTKPYQSSREDMILNFTFDTLHTQIFFREASELILGQREELKAPFATTS